MWKRLQPGEGPSEGLLCECEIFANLRFSSFEALMITLIFRLTFWWWGRGGGSSRRWWSAAPAASRSSWPWRCSPGSSGSLPASRSDISANMRLWNKCQMQFSATNNQQVVQARNTHGYIHGEIIYGGTRWIEDDCSSTFSECIFLFPACLMISHWLTKNAELNSVF